jgi:hypothetical protein
MPPTVTRPGAAHVSAGQTFTDPDEIACATEVATAQLNARARPWVWGRPATVALLSPALCVHHLRNVALSVKNRLSSLYLEREWWGGLPRASRAWPSAGPSPSGPPRTMRGVRAQCLRSFHPSTDAPDARDDQPGQLGVGAAGDHFGQERDTGSRASAVRTPISRARRRAADATRRISRGTALRSPC